MAAAFLQHSCVAFLQHFFASAAAILQHFAESFLQHVCAAAFLQQVGVAAFFTSCAMVWVVLIMQSAATSAIIIFFIVSSVLWCYLSKMGRVDSLGGFQLPETRLQIYD